MVPSSQNQPYTACTLRCGLFPSAAPTNYPTQHQSLSCSQSDCPQGLELLSACMLEQTLVLVEHYSWVIAEEPQ